MPSPVSGSTRPAASPTSSTAPCRRRPASPHRQPGAVQVGELCRVDPVRGTEPAQVLADARPLARPAADAVVRVVGLREDPAVAAGNDADFDRREPALPLPRAGRSPRGRCRTRSRRRGRTCARRRRSRRRRRRAPARPTRKPPIVSSAPSGPTVKPPAVTPSRKSTPAAAACSARKASRRRRLVIRTSGASLRRSKRFR